MEQYKGNTPLEPGRDSDFQRLVRQRKQVPVNTAVILLNILVFLLVEITGTSLNAQHMVDCGASYTPYIYQGHQYYRLVTSMFLHFGIQHLGNNMLVLFFVGDCLERTVGKIKYLLIYLLGGIGANVISLALEISHQEAVVSAGASGAVFAVIGALIYIVIRNRGYIENFTARQLLILAALSLYHGVTSAGVDNAAHFGGLLCGFVLCVLLYHRRHL